MLTRAQVAELYTPIYDEFFLSTYKESTQKHPLVYDVIDDTTKEHKVDDLSALGEWVDAAEGEGGGYETPVQGYVKTYTPSKRWKKLATTFEAVDQDEYALLKKEDDIKAMGRGGRASIEKNSANHLSDGFATAGPDGQFLWDSDHPKNSEETGTTYDNLLSGAFSHDNLETAETQIMNNYMDPKGIPIEPDEDPILLYPPGLRGITKRVLSDRALERPDTTNRDINRFAGMYNPVEWRYLASIHGGSNTAWFIIFKSMGMLKVVWQARPSFSSWIDEEDEVYNHKGRMIYDLGASNYRCGFASTGL